MYDMTFLDFDRAGSHCNDTLKVAETIIDKTTTDGDLISLFAIPMRKSDPQQLFDHKLWLMHQDTQHHVSL